MNYHILTQAINKSSADVVFHIPVPSQGTNEAAISWSAAVVLEQGGADNITSILPSLVGTQEEADMKTGALIEIRRSVKFSTISQDVAQRKTQIEAKYNELATEIIDEKQITLEWIGKEGNV